VRRGPSWARLGVSVSAQLWRRRRRMPSRPSRASEASTPLGRGLVDVAAAAVVVELVGAVDGGVGVDVAVAGGRVVARGRGRRTAVIAPRLLLVRRLADAVVVAAVSALLVLFVVLADAVVVAVTAAVAGGVGGRVDGGVAGGGGGVGVAGGGRAVVGVIDGLDGGAGLVAGGVDGTQAVVERDDVLGDVEGDAPQVFAVPLAGGREVAGVHLGVAGVVAPGLDVGAAVGAVGGRLEVVEHQRRLVVVDAGVEGVVEAELDVGGELLVVVEDRRGGVGEEVDVAADEDLLVKGVLVLGLGDVEDAVLVEVGEDERVGGRGGGVEREDVLLEGVVALVLHQAVGVDLAGLKAPRTMSGLPSEL
jgi:hypothetical protein